MYGNRYVTHPYANFGMYTKFHFLANHQENENDQDNENHPDN